MENRDRETSSREADRKDDSTAVRSENLDEPNERGVQQSDTGKTGDSKGRH